MALLTVTSADGTTIQSQCYGAGRALVIVSGALFASELWLRVVPLISGRRRAVVVDRRGRGKSGDHSAYSVTREIEDLLAVLEGVGGPVDLLGHSAGAILALHVALRSPANLERLIVYEPPVFLAAADRVGSDLPERLEVLLAQGRHETAVETFFREGPRASEAELRGMKAGPAWALMVKELAHTVAYDAHVQRSFSEADAAALSRVRIPALMLLGAASPARVRGAAETISARLPAATLRELPGQQHVAMLSAPALFASAVNDFLDAPVPAG
ncbi:MAG TPA: alpha/beta hydrolase [Polyangiaceae bacterium]|nr:alpha/beta hydrolase [Polyangiaceae bacterium]